MPAVPESAWRDHIARMALARLHGRKPTQHARPLPAQDAVRRSIDQREFAGVRRG